MPWKWIKNNRFTIAVCLAILFFICILIFNNRINKALQNKQDFTIPLSYRKQEHDKRHIISKKYETRCRQIFESIFRRSFPSVRPAFLKRSNGKCLELDGYNNELKLGFEYQGRQHYQFSTMFHRTMDDFYQQKQRDIDKREMCRRSGVTVIEIPYTVKYEKLEDYIKNALSGL